MGHSKEAWREVEKDYRVGEMSLRQLKDEHGITVKAIRQKAKKEGWERDLKERIRISAVNLINKRAAIKAAEKEEKDVEDEDIVDFASAEQADIIVSHRGLIGKHKELLSMLYEELNSQTVSLELMSSIGELMDQSAETGKLDKLNELYHKIIALPSRIDSYKKLADSMKTVIGLERQAFNIADNSDGNNDKPADIIQVYIPENGR